jgi:tetratricopeptide (TPR) repeat protein
MTEIAIVSRDAEAHSIAAASSPAVALPVPVAGEFSAILTRMFRDPRVLAADERSDLITHLRQAVELHPQVAEVRVLLGMALSVDLQAQEAMEQLRQATQQAPNCFIARLKFGELLMRLRICGQAAEETQRAAELATNTVQSEMARKQAATIRTMLREGVERGGPQKFLSRLLPFRKKTQAEMLPTLARSR